MKELQAIKQLDDPHIKVLKFMALLNSEVKKILPYARPVIVGGSAVLIYTFGGQLTRDIDVIVNELEEEAISKVLLNFGFKRQAGHRHWYNEDLDIILEFPSGDLAGSIDKLTTIEVDGSDVYVIGIEDLLIDRLNSAKHCNDIRDFEQCAVLIRSIDIFNE